MFRDLRSEVVDAPGTLPVAALVIFGDTVGE